MKRRACGSRLWGKGCERDWKKQELWGKTFRVSVREQFTPRPDGSVSWDTAGTVCPSGGIGEAIMDLQVSLAGFVGTMMLMRQEPAIMHEFLHKSCDAALSQLKMLDQAIGK